MAKNQTKAVLDNFKIQSYVDSLFESNAGKNQRLQHFLSEYQKVLEQGNAKEFMIYEEFGHGLANFATGNKAVKKVINEMNTNLTTYGKELNTYKLMECICDDAAKCACEDAYTHYLASKDESSKKILCDACDALEQAGDPVAQQLTIVIARPNAQIEPQPIQIYDNSKFDEIQRKIEEDKLRQKVEDAKAEIDAYAEQVFAAKKAEQEAERKALVFDNVVNNNGICLKESINNILNSDAKTNKKLVETVEQYKGALAQGLYEERLFEGFIKNITPFNYLKSVDREIKRLEKVAEERTTPIAITKVLEEMYTTNSYYIIPMIEEDACRFIKDPSPVNCNQLKAALVSFASDPYCHAMLEALEDFDNKPAFLINDNTISIKDRTKLIKEHANISNVYSPIQYIKENECVFNVNGQFYVKKGNTLAKLSEEYVPQLSESFIALCQLVNDPHVSINENYITLVGNDKVANIFENHIEINGNKETKESLRDLNEMSLRYDFDTNFFVMASCLAENFNNIANVNFAKHIALNEDAGVNVDLFNLNGNIFVNAVNEEMLKATFYHNVNPIQCRNLINNHMGINVASLFEELIPSQDKLYLKLNETKSEYEASIAKYEATIEKLKKAKEEDISEDSEKKLDAAIEAAQAKVDELKKEYKDWQDDVDKVTKPDSKSEDADKDEDIKDDNTEVEKSNEPIDAEDVEAAKADLSTPLSQEAGDLSISDDEFDSYLEGDSEVPGDEMDPTDVNMAHHALAGDGRENEEPNPDELADPMGDDEISAEDGEATLTPVDTDDEDPFDAEIGGDEEELPTGDEEEINPDEPIDFEGDEETSEEPIDADSAGVPEEAEGVAIPEGYKIANIKFDENLKTGELFRTGSITVMVDMVDGSGKVYTESNNYHFYIDEDTHLPVIDAADVPVALYNALVSSIQADVQFAKADAEGKGGETVKSEPVADEVYYNADDVNAASDELQKDDEEGYFDFTDDGEGDITFSAKEESPVDLSDEFDSEDVVPTNATPAKPIKASDLFGGVEDEPDVEEVDSEEVITPTYKVDDTVIDKPAENIDFEDEDPFDDEDSEEAFDEEDDSFDSNEKDFPDFDDVKDEKDDDNDKEDIDESEELVEEMQAPGAPQQNQQPQQGQQTQANGQQPVQNASTAQPQQPQQGQTNGQQQPQQNQQPHANGQQPVQNASTAQPQQNQQNESIKVESKISLNEARAAFVKLKAEYKKNTDKKSFINEGASKPSKKEVVNETKKVNETSKAVKEKAINPAIDKLHEYAEAHTSNTTDITEIKSFNDIRYFGIVDLLNQNEPMAVYEMNNKVYYGNYDDLNEVIECIESGVNSEKDLELLEGEQPQCVSSEMIKDGYDLIDTLLYESVKIKKPGLTTKGDIRLSQQRAEILNGTKDRRDFEKKVERLSDEAGVANPLLPQPQQESVNIEDAKELSESVIDKNNIEVIYEPQDWVIIKQNGMKAQVINVVNDGDGNLRMLTILASNGVTYDADPEEIEPDPMYLTNLPGVAVNSTLMQVPRLATFGINPKTRLTDIVNNDDPALDEKYKDFN